MREYPLEDLLEDLIDHACATAQDGTLALSISCINTNKNRFRAGLSKYGKMHNDLQTAG